MADGFVLPLLTSAGTCVACTSILLLHRKRVTDRERVFIPTPALYPPLSADTLAVETSRFLDTDREELDGPYNYLYSGMYYQFRHGNRSAGGRWYDDEADSMSISIAPLRPPRNRAQYREPPYGDPLLAEVVYYLSQHEPERVHLKMLCADGYLPVDRVRALRRK